MNIVEFALKFKDLASGELGKFGAQTKRIFDNATRQGVNFGHQFNMAETSVFNLTKRINELRAQRDIMPLSELSKIRQFNSEIKTLEKRMTKMQTLNGSWLKSKFSDAMSSLPGAGFITNPIVAMGAGLAVSIKKGMENEMQRTNITTLMGGDSKASDALFGKISKYGKETVYDKAGLIDSQRTMMSFGLSSDFAFNKLKQIGDIAMGDKNRMQSLSLAFSQATSTGKLMGQDLLQMINAGFNPLNVISEKTGESMESLKDRMSKGQISAQELAKSFEWATEKGGLFYQGAEKAGNTLTGKMNKMADSLSEMAISLYGAIEPILKPLVSFATTIFEVIGNGVDKLVIGFKEGNPAILAVTSAIAGLTAGIALYKIITAIAAVAQSGFTIAVWASNFALLANPIVWVTALVVGLVGGLILLWKKSEGFRSALYGIWEVMKGFGNILKEFVIDRIKGVLSGLGSMGQAILKLFKGDFKGAWQSAKEGANGLLGLDAATNAYNNARKLGGLYEQGVAKGRADFRKGKKSAVEKTNTGLLTDTAAAVATNNTVASNSEKSLSSGGPKVVNITIGKFLEDIKIYPTNLTEGVSDIEGKILEMFARVVSQGAVAI